MLDYGYRSRCCKAPIKMGFKKLKTTNVRKAIWICTKCLSRDVAIVAKSDLQNQI